MPRRNEEEDDDTLEEDYLTVDKSLPGQSFVCLSFVSPEKVIAKREEYFFHRYFQQKLNKYNKDFTEAIEQIVKKTVRNTVDISQIVQLKKNMTKLFKEDAVDFDGFNDKVEDFRIGHEQEINDKFDAENNFQTSVRGVKVRGVYDTHREASVRAKVLQRQDPTFDVFIGQVGYWLPWDPTPDNVENQEYAEDQLNKLVKGQKDNQAKKDMFFQEQTRKRKTEAKEMNDRMKTKLEAKKRAEEEGRVEKETVRQEDNDAVANAAIEEEDSNKKHELDNDDIENILGRGIEDKLNAFNDTDNSDDTIEEVKFDVGSEKAKEVSLEETSDQLLSADPWMQRKLEEEKEKEKEKEQ